MKVTGNGQPLDWVRKHICQILQAGGWAGVAAVAGIVIAREGQLRDLEKAVWQNATRLDRLEQRMTRHERREQQRPPVNRERAENELLPPALEQKQPPDPQTGEE